MKICCYGLRKLFPFLSEINMTFLSFCVVTLVLYLRRRAVERRATAAVMELPPEP